MLKPRVNYRNMPPLTPDEFIASMREYAETLLEAVKNIPEPETIKRKLDVMHGPKCVCEQCFCKNR